MWKQVTGVNGDRGFFGFIISRKCQPPTSGKMASGNEPQPITSKFTESEELMPLFTLHNILQN